MVDTWKAEEVETAYMMTGEEQELGIGMDR